MEPLRIGLYLRLSRDDEREGESQSIANQRRLLRQYVQTRGWTTADEYSDDGYTGTNFDRPAFRRLLDDIEAKKINTVITKDLSRLGRDQIMTAYYYQIYFPQKKVRYIAVAEGFDTADGGAGSALFPFLAAANDFYTADISRKVRSALTARTREGKFIGSEAPLGYQKDPLEKGHLIIDPAGAEIIRRIFRLYQSLGSIARTAKALTEEKVPTPAEYRNGSSAAGRFSGVWSGETVRRILTNPTYAGDLTQHRTEKINYKVKQRTALPPEQWIIISGTHEPIIGREQFKQVQNMIRVRGYRGEKRGDGHLLTGLAFCAGCGSPMTYVRESPTQTYMVCQGWRKGGRLSGCTSHRVREDRVIEALQAQLFQLGGQVDRTQLAACYQTADQQARVRALLSFEKLDRGTVTALVRRVLIHQDKTVEIQVRFRGPE